MKLYPPTLQKTVSKAEITAKVENKAQRLPDGNGLVLVIQPSGGKLWRYRYYFKKKGNELSLGKYPKVSLKDARALHSDLRNLLSEGINPSEHRKEQKEKQSAIDANSFESVARRWWEHWRPSVTVKTAAYKISRLETYILPAIGSKPITEIRASMIIKQIQKVQDKGKKDLPKRLLNSCNQIFRFAVSHDLVTHNPLASIQPKDILIQYETEHRKRVPIEELPQLLRDIESYQGKVTRYALQIMAYTFTRSRELAEAAWSEFDIDNKTWVIPLTRQTKLKSPLTVHLAEPVIKILRKLQEITGDKKHVFNSELIDGQPFSENTMMNALERLGYKGRMDIHGFRGIARTEINENPRFKYETTIMNTEGEEEKAWINKYSTEQMEVQLGHLIGSETQRAYNSAEHLLDRARMLRDWANYLDALKSGSDALPPSAA